MNKISKNVLHIYTDGGARGNPGPAAVGVVINDHKGGTIHQFATTIGRATNNIAEYQAVVLALQWLIDNKSSYRLPLICNFYLDSKLVVNQLNGTWKIKNAQLRQQVINIHLLEAQIATSFKYHAVPRQENHRADALLNQALDQK